MIRSMNFVELSVSLNAMIGMLTLLASFIACFSFLESLISMSFGSMKSSLFGFVNTPGVTLPFMNLAFIISANFCAATMAYILDAVTTMSWGLYLATIAAATFILLSMVLRSKRYRPSSLTRYMNFFMPGLLTFVAMCMPASKYSFWFANNCSSLIESTEKETRFSKLEN